MTAVLEREARVDVARAWRDAAYYEGLSAEEKALVPANPAGEFDLDVDLRSLTRAPIACYADNTPNCTCLIRFHTGTCTV